MENFIEKYTINSKPLLLREAGRKNIGTKGQYRLLALYKCYCGNEFVASHYDINRGGVKSCGCLLKQNGYKHGYSKTKLYGTWSDMKKRCYDKNTNNYHDYGGRGIVVCDRWLESFKNFLEDMGEKPGKEYSIDRIDVDGDYCLENCRWATVDVQNRNRRTNFFIEYKGERKCLTDWCRFFNKDRTTLATVVFKTGSVEKAFDLLYLKIRK